MMPPLRNQHDTSDPPITTKAAYALAGAVATGALGLALKIVAGNLLGIEDLGIYGLVLGIYLITGMTASAGIPAALLRCSAWHQHDPHNLGSLLSAALVLSALTGLAGSAALSCSATWIGHALARPALTTLLRTVALGVPLFVANKTLLAFLAGLRVTWLVALIDTIRSLIMLASTYSLVHHAGHGLQGAVWALVTPEPLILPCLLLTATARCHPALSGFTTNAVALLKLGLAAFTANVVSTVGSKLQTMLAAALLSDRELGAWVTASALHLGLVALARPASALLAATVSAQLATGDRTTATRTANRAATYSLSLYTILGATCILLTPTAPRLLFPGHPRFVDACLPLTVLMFSLPASGAAHTLAAVPMAAGRPHWSLTCAAFSLCLHLALGLLLVPQLGLLGCALAATVTHTATAALLGLLLTRIGEPK